MLHFAYLISEVIQKSPGDDDQEVERGLHLSENSFFQMHFEREFDKL